MKAHVHVYVPDVHEACARALKAGAHEVQAPMQKDDDKRSGVVDANGVTWWIGTKVESMATAYPALPGDG